MRYILGLLTLFAVSIAMAEPTYVVNGKQTTQVEATQTLLRDPKALVLKCEPQEIKINKSSIAMKKKASN